VRWSWPARLSILTGCVSLAAAAVISAPAQARAVEPTLITSFTVGGQLLGVAAISVDDAWAVGWTGPSQTTLILHWNGDKWTRVTTPKPVYGTLDAVTAVSPDDIWAVGNTQTSGGLDPKALVMHWNGKAWSRQSGVVAAGGVLYSVAASKTTVWAVGGFGVVGEGPALILHRTSNRWYTLPTPTSESSLQGVVMSRAGTWAVGVAIGNVPQPSLLMQWTGTMWRMVDSPLQRLDGLSWSGDAANQKDLWVVGYADNNTDSSYTPYSIVRTGKSWRKVAVSAPKDSALDGVAAIPGGTAWAVGEASAQSRKSSQTLIDHWNGTSWQQVKSPDSGPFNGLYAVAASSVNNAWAVGSTSTARFGDYGTLILHWNGKSWS
jgi:hypothetical protein